MFPGVAARRRRRRQAEVLVLQQQEPRDEAGEGHPGRLLLLPLPMRLQVVERMLLQVLQLLGAMPNRIVHRPPPLPLLQPVQPQLPQTTKLHHHHLRKTHQSSRTSPKPTSTGTSS